MAKDLRAVKITAKSHEAILDNLSEEDREEMYFPLLALADSGTYFIKEFQRGWWIVAGQRYMGQYYFPGVEESDYCSPIDHIGSRKD